MDLQLTDEQIWLAESIGELVARQAGDDGLVAPGAGSALWDALVEFGALEIDPSAEALGAVELVLVARALGERLAAVPFVGSAALRYALGGDADLRAATTVAVALSEPGRRFAPTDPSTTYDGTGVTGEKAHVAFAAGSERLALSASAVGGAQLVLVASDDAGVSIDAEQTLDLSLGLAHVRLDGVPARALGEHGSDVERLAAVGAVLASSEAVGAASALLNLATEYAGQRRQFGRTIGSFQTIRHLLADLVVQVEASWSSVLYSAASLDERQPGSVQDASVTKAWSSRATLAVAHGALQVFGGIAFTAEHPAHRFLRRIAALGGLYGDAAEHERALGRTIANQVEVST
jgi:alkylation response protein AidB-like acyl-CoA dehydrogenase